MLFLDFRAWPGAWMRLKILKTAQNFSPGPYLAMKPPQDIFWTPLFLALFGSFYGSLWSTNFETMILTSVGPISTGMPIFSFLSLAVFSQRILEQNMRQTHDTHTNILSLYIRYIYNLTLGINNFKITILWWFHY